MHWRGVTTNSARVSYLLYRCAFIPEGMEVAHQCDNIRCVNPMHLELESHQQNVARMWDRIRAKRDHGHK